MDGLKNAGAVACRSKKRDLVKKKVEGNKRKTKRRGYLRGPG
jgi:hypothetical protein